MNDAASPRGVGGWMSQSAWRDYEWCPRRYWHAHVDATPADRPVWEGWRFARAVHSALEAALAAVQGTSQRPGDPVGLAAAREALERARVVDGLDDDQAGEADDLVAGSLASLPVRGEQVLAVEARLRADSPAGVRVVGRADLVVRWEDGSLGICDHKVSRRPRSPDELAADRQLALYGWMAASRWPASEGITVSHHYPPLRRTVHAALTRDHIDRVVADLDAVAARIAADEAFPAQPGDHCRTCRWTATCPEGPSSVHDAGSAG